MATAQNIALAHSLPPRLLNFFKRFPPPQLSAASTTTSKPARETITVTENTSSSDPNAGASQVEVPLPSETTTNDNLQLGWKKNPFLAFKNPSTGNWHPPHYSLRRQADLFKLATAHNVLSLMPPSPKHPEIKQQKRIEHGLRVKGTGEGQKVKGKYWERTLKTRLETRRKAMETMPDMINLWRERGHGRGWKKYPSGKEGKGTADLFNPEMRHAWPSSTPHDLGSLEQFTGQLIYPEAASAGLGNTGRDIGPSGCAAMSDTAQTSQHDRIRQAGKCGEAYLGYKNRPEVVANLRSIWHEVRNNLDMQDCAMEPAQPPACVVLVNGFPGTGKLAVARALRSKLGDTDTRLVDNHLIIDPAEATHPGRGFEHKALRDVIRRAVFQDLKGLPENITTIILTGCLGQNSEDVAVYAEHVELAQARGVPFHSFALAVEKSEHLLRLQSPDRVYGQKTKLNDPAVLETIMTNNEILDPTIVVDFRAIRHHPIDTTGLTVSESADRVLDIIVRQQEQQRSASPA
ncbi:hypothetical protein D0864_01443 [Hortaea werneckii]|uniref:Large ribosomal subunit protein mL59 domain-containing protein n=1 Tax=Hortaea werneckii TaxID=91943 RepID=A0A3M7H8U2_HORWE|nr:hypothetical protein D0864_01443 [Hortaea werneckii]